MKWSFLSTPHVLGTPSALSHCSRSSPICRSHSQDVASGDKKSFASAVLFVERLVKRHLGGVGGERGAIVLRGCFSRLDLAGNAPPLAPGMDPGQGGGEGSRFLWQEQSCDPAQPSVCWENTNRITSPVKHIFLPSPCRFHGKQWIFS